MKTSFPALTFAVILAGSLAVVPSDAITQARRSKKTIVHKAAVPKPAPPPVRIASGPLAPLTLGVGQIEKKDFAAAVVSLTRVHGQFPKIADYVDYYLAFAQSGKNDPTAAVRALGDLHEFIERQSPLLAKAVILDAQSRVKAAIPSPEIFRAALQALRGQGNALTQPEGDFAMALAFDGINDGAQAATYYQRVYFLYPATEMAAQSAEALERLKQSLGAGYPPALPQLMLERPAGWIKAKEYGKARAEFENLIPLTGGLERDQARVRIGAAIYGTGDYRGAFQYLKALDVQNDEADAERWYLMEESARGMHDDDQMMEAVKHLARHHEHSAWRLKALVAAGNRYLMTHQPDQYEPLYRAAWAGFPSDSSTAYCHWKITWDAYLANRHDARELLREQVEKYPGDNKSAGALYFLGRRAESDNEDGVARAYYERLNAQFPNFYYAVLARERLTAARIVAATPDPKIVTWLDTIEFPAHVDYSSQTANEATRARIERVRTLAAAGLNDLAESEVRFACKLDGQPHLLAIELASSDAAPHLSLRHMKALAPDYLTTPLSGAPKNFWRMLFPLPFEGELVASARKQNLDPFIVAGLIRQESEFNPSAHSYANAYGLTQIVPATGRMLARQTGMRVFTTNLLYQPDTNLRLGTTYMRELLDQWNGRWEETLASYNAGASRVKEWHSWANYREPAEFVESIPITQTREYVQAVLRNAAVYREIYGSAANLHADPEPELPLGPKPAAPLRAVARKPHPKAVAKAPTRKKAQPSS